jgi:hypothetical protein
MHGMLNNEPPALALAAHLRPALPSAAFGTLAAVAADSAGTACQDRSLKGHSNTVAGSSSFRPFFGAHHINEK